MDIVGPAGTGLRREVALSFIPVLDRVESELRRQTELFDGVIIERKRFSISTHVRQADPSVHREVEEIVDTIGHAHESLRREGGKMLYELRPNIEWDKGAAVEWLLAELELDPATALYVGDDLTDETVFAVLAGQGATVVVSDPGEDRRTAARFRLDGTGEVLQLLERLVAASTASR